MAKKIPFITIILLTLIVGGWFGYQYWEKNKKTNVWSLIPESALIAYESKQSAQVWNELIQTPIWSDLSSITFYKEMEDDITLLDSMTGKKGIIDNVLRNQSFVFSIHAISKESLGFMYFVPIDASNPTYMYKLLTSFQKSADFKYLKRNYLDVAIHELKSKSNKKIFTYIIYKDYFIGSFNALLIEEVIRKIDANTESFIEKNDELKKLTKIEDDHGNFYVNTMKISQLLRTFVNTEYRSLLKVLDPFAQTTYLDAKINEDYLLLNGFTFASKEENFLNTFEGQSPHPLLVKKYIPNSTALFYHFAFDDGTQWHNELIKSWKLKQNSQWKQWDKFSTIYTKKLSPFLQEIGQEIGLATLESVDIDNPDQLFYIHAKDIVVAQEKLYELSLALNESSQDTLYREFFSELPITQIKTSDFPEIVFGPLFRGFEECFYFPLGDYIIFSDRIEVIKQFINDVEEENVWGKSLDMNELLKNTEDANISVYVNTRKVWNIFLQKLSPQWKSFMEEHVNIFKRFEFLSLQLSNTDADFYTSILLKHKKQQQINKNQLKYNLVQSTNIDFYTSTKPFVVKNSSNNSLEVMLQDSAQQLYLISNKGEILWKRDISQAIKGDIFQIDFYKNGKLQYFFGTRDSLYVIDRNGNNVANYPHALPAGVKLDKVSIVDYDKSKRYRFFVADESGNLYLFDKNMKNLDGWNPKQLTYSLGIPPQHIRVRGKDCMVAVQEDGTINVMSRKGEMLSGFPLKLHTKLNNPLFVSFGINLKNTTCTTVSNDGELIVFNFAGQLLNREQLYKPTQDTYFKMAIDGLEKTFIIARQEGNKITLLDHRGKTLFEDDYSSTGEMEVQYYNFGSDNELFVIIDHAQEFTYLYDREGKLINDTPLESGYPIGLIYSEKQKRYKIYTTFGQRFNLYSFKN